MQITLRLTPNDSDMVQVWVRPFKNYRGNREMLACVIHEDCFHEAIDAFFGKLRDGTVDEVVCVLEEKR